MDPDRSERKEKSEGDADARSERSELVEGEERSEKGEGSEKLDTSEIADKLEGGAGGSSTSGRSKWSILLCYNVIVKCHRQKAKETGGGREG